MANVYIATTDAIVGTESGSVSIRAGVTRVVEGHPLLKDHPGMFRLAEEDAHFGAPETTRQEPQVPRSRGDRGGAGAFDPSAHTVDEVNAYLAKADEAERERVLAAEAAGKNRATVGA